MRDVDMILALVDACAVPFDHLQTERDLRPSTVQHTIAGTFHSAPRATACCYRRGVLSTWRTQGHSTQHALEAGRFRQLLSIPPETVVSRYIIKELTSHLRSNATACILYTDGGVHPIPRRATIHLVGHPLPRSSSVVRRRMNACAPFARPHHGQAIMRR